MADVITRFKLETTQYDSKLRDASKSLAEYTRQATLAGNEFGKFTQKSTETVRALGTITPSANNAKDKVKELVGAFNDVAKAYNALTKEQQQSDFGKAMSESLSQLSQQLREAKQELYDMGDAVKTSGAGGGLFSGLGDKMGGALQVFAGNMLTKAAGAVANLGSEMVGMVQQGVEMAKAGEGIRIAFERLGRGDILDGLRQATHGTVTDLELMKAAVKFNDFKLPLDELGTMLAFAQQKAKDTGQSVDYMVDSIVTGLGRKSLMILDNLGLSATEVKDKMAETGDMTKAVGEIIREQMSKAGDYVETAADRAAQANVSLQNKMEELGRKFAPLEEASNSLWTSMKIGILDIIGGPLADLLNKLTQAGRMANAYGLMGGNAKVGRMTANLAGASEGKRQSIYQQQQEQFWRYINPREQQIRDIRAWQSGDRNEALQKRIGAITDKYGSLDATKIQAEVDAAKKMLSDYQAAAKQILQPIEQKIVPTVGDGGSGGKGGGGRSGGGGGHGGTGGSDVDDVDIYAIVAGQWDKAMLKGAIAGVKGTDMTGPSEAWEAYVASVKNGSQEAADSLQRLTDAYNELNKAEGVTPTGELAQDGKKIKSSWGDAASAISGVGSALSSIEDPTAKILGIVAQAIAGVAAGAGQAVSAKDTTSSGWAWIGAAAAITASMVAMISQIHSATGYANGGIVRAAGGTVVPGNNYSGDMVPAMLNSGELVLNRAQQGNLASQLEGGSMRNLQLSATIKGEDIRLVLNNNGRRTGRGEYVTTNFT